MSIACALLMAALWCVAAYLTQEKEMTMPAIFTGSGHVEGRIEARFGRDSDGRFFFELDFVDASGRVQGAGIHLTDLSAADVETISRAAQSALIDAELVGLDDVLDMGEAERMRSGLPFDLPASASSNALEEAQKRFRDNMAKAREGAAEIEADLFPFGRAKGE